MKEKKMVACVVLGVSLVSLITFLIAAFAESLVDLSGDYVKHVKIAGGVTLGGVLLGIAFVTAFFVNKKKCFAVNLGLAITVVAYCVITIIALSFDYRDYGIFSSYLTSALTLAVSTALTFVAWYYLTLIKQKEASEKTEQETDANKE